MNNPKLLCIDDSQLVQSLVARELEGYEVELHFANDGAEGLDCCLREMPDLVMLDLRMPTMDGIEFLKKWKAELGFADTRFIIMTSETSKDIVEAVLRLGISEYIAKPFSGKTLISRLSQHITLKKRETRTPIPHTPRLFSSTAEVSNSEPVATRPPVSDLSFRTIRVLTRKSESHYAEVLEEEHSLHEIISKYQVLLGAKNAYLTSVLAELLKEGKVFVESEKFSERIQLKYDANKIDSATAASLLARYFEEQRRESQVNASTTQRIVLHRPTARTRPSS